jgi:hypothetical protein
LYSFQVVKIKPMSKLPVELLVELLFMIKLAFQNIFSNILLGTCN